MIVWTDTWKLTKLTNPKVVLAKLFEMQDAFKTS